MIGKTVYLKTDPDSLPRVVTGKLERPGSVQWGLTHSNEGESWHYECEIVHNVMELKKKAGFK